MKVTGQLKEFEIIGRKLPTEKTKNLPSPFYKMRIFAPDYIVAKSRFWYFLRQLKKIKKSTGEIVSLKEIPEKSPCKIKNFGIWLRYDSRSGTHNMYREYRDVTVAGAVTLCYRDMGARHRARAHSIQIIKVEEVKASNCRRPQVTQFHDSKIKFPLPKRIRGAKKGPLFSVRRPRTYYM
ncbi:60S ribosomal protein L18A, putative [Pediculus humanus corporis]|uniref:60S ribosomal protein L18a n=1 Tax=Pediculus humanus subsp. corporis TaxID=121224 RepID=E0VNP5_PEDHC|nr:60S ribosomal protein L18A, putative [Pediculus humanus corporis]EEB15001.1 60S ribosomal protein L18A, putative [Pediculus humanus corporis]